MALSNKKILKGIKKGEIVINPFVRENLGTSSYDVTLGQWFFRENRQSFKVYNIYSEKHTKRVWGEPQKAVTAKSVLGIDPNFEFGDGINEDDEIILIEPGETLLAHTVEFIGGVSKDTTEMKTRSTYGRQFIGVCKCAGWGDVGFFNRWTMEVTNFSRYYTIPLLVNSRIAQIPFHHTGQIIGKDYTGEGKYQTGGVLEDLQAAWHPELMLPRLYKDREIVAKNARSKK